MSTAIVRIVSELRSIIAAWRREGLRIAVVPTMGALHEGHLSLVQTALTKADRVIVTLFVNPRQFNNAADLAAYPRTEHDDAAKLASVGAHILYAPNAADIYPPGFATTVSVGGVSEGLCGTFRPGHFDGVATVVTKLLLQSEADLAFFGEKDFQQLHVVRQQSRSSLARRCAKPMAWRCRRVTRGSLWLIATGRLGWLKSWSKPPGS